MGQHIGPADAVPGSRSLRPLLRPRSGFGLARPHRARPLSRAAAMPGLRQGELLAFRWRDVTGPPSASEIVAPTSEVSTVTPKSKQAVDQCR